MPNYGEIVVIKRNGTDGTHFTLTATTCLFGRKSDCDIRIQLPHVSKEHCKVEVKENAEVFVTNLSTVNPTQLNGNAIKQPVCLKHGDVLTIIDRSFRFEKPRSHQGRRRSAALDSDTLKGFASEESTDTNETVRVENIIGKGHRKSEGNISRTTHTRQSLQSNLSDREVQSPFSELYETFKNKVEPGKKENRQTPVKESSRSPKNLPVKQNVKSEVMAQSPVASKRDSRRSRSSDSTPVQRRDVNMEARAVSADRGREPSKSPAKRFRISLTKEKQSSVLEAESPRISKKESSPVHKAATHNHKQSPRRRSGTEVSLSGSPVVSSNVTPEKRSPRRSTGAEQVQAAARVPSPSDSRRSRDHHSVSQTEIENQENLPLPAKSPLGRSRSSPIAMPAEATSPKKPVKGADARKSPKKRRSDELSLPEPPLKRKRVSFGGHLSPELFDKRLPPNSPLKKGATPARRSLSINSPRMVVRKSFGLKQSVIKEIFEFSASQQANSLRTPTRRASSGEGSSSITPEKPATSPNRSPSVGKKTPSKSPTGKTQSFSPAKRAGPSSKTPVKSEPTTPAWTPLPKDLGLATKVSLTPQRSLVNAPELASPTKRSPAKSSSTSPAKRSPAKSPSRTSAKRSPAKSPSTAPAKRSPAKSPSRTPAKRSPAKSPSRTPAKRSPAKSPSKTPAKRSPAKSPSTAPAKRSPAKSPSRTPAKKSPAKSPSTAKRSPATSPKKSPSKLLSSPAINSAKRSSSLTSPKSPSRKSTVHSPSTPAKSPAKSSPTLARKSLAKSPTPLSKSPEKPSTPAKSPLTVRRSAKLSTVAKSPIKSSPRSPATSVRKSPASVSPARRSTPYAKGRFSVSRIDTPPQKTENVSEVSTQTPKLTRRSLASKKTPHRRSRKLDAFEVIRARRRSGASEANLFVAKSWADVVRIGIAKPQKKVDKPIKSVAAKKKLRSKTPVRRGKDLSTTGHADSPATILVGKAHTRTVDLTGNVPRVVRNAAVKLNRVHDESFTGMMELFSTPVNVKQRRSNRFEGAKMDTPKSSVERSALQTPEETGEMVVSPLNSPATTQRKRFGRDAVSRLLEVPASPVSEDFQKDAEQEASTSKNRKSVGLTGVKRIMRTPKQKGKPVTDPHALRKLLKTPNENEFPQLNTRRSTKLDVLGIAQLVKTPKQKGVPVEDFAGIKRIMKTPKQKGEPVEDLVGIKRVMRTPRQKVEPVEDLTGVKRVMQTPKQRGQPVEDMVGIKRLMTTPKERGQPVEDMIGLKRLMTTPKNKGQPVEDLVGIANLLRTPKQKAQPVDLVGIKQLMKTPKERRPLVEDIDFSSLIATPTDSAQSSENARPIEEVFGMKNLVKTPPKKVSGKAS
ncbi:proliferation marker protein Ki-67 [Gastrophryne carolinensis]